jgi:hypothetical protein
MISKIVSWVFNFLAIFKLSKVTYTCKRGGLISGDQSWRAGEANRESDRGYQWIFRSDGGGEERVRREECVGHNQMRNELQHVIRQGFLLEGFSQGHHSTSSSPSLPRQTCWIQVRTDIYFETVL